jgi:hypothetical protein
MRKLLILLVLTFMTANSVGCCCRGLRDYLFQGGSCCPLLCGGTTTYAPATYAVAPACASPCGTTYAAPTTYAPTYAAAPAYAAAPTYAAPMAATMAAPQYAAPQYTMAAPMATSCGDPCSSGCSPCASACSPCSGGCSTCGGSYPAEMGCSTCGTPVVGMSYVAAPSTAEPSCAYSDGATPAPTAVYPSPAAE